MKKKRKKNVFSFTLGNKELESLDTLAAYAGTNRSDIMRGLIPSKETVDAAREVLRYNRIDEQHIVEFFRGCFTHDLVERMVYDSTHSIEEQLYVVCCQPSGATGNIRVPDEVKDKRIARLFISFMRAKLGTKGYRFKRTIFMKKRYWIVVSPEDTEESIEHLKKRIQAYMAQLLTCRDFTASQLGVTPKAANIYMETQKANDIGLVR